MEELFSTSFISSNKIRSARLQERTERVGLDGEIPAEWIVNSTVA